VTYTRYKITWKSGAVTYENVPQTTQGILNWESYCHQNEGDIDNIQYLGKREGYPL